MKTQFLALLVVGLGWGVALGGTTTITDFSTIKGGTAVDGITLTATNATLTPTGGLDLTDGSLAFNFNDATNQPSIAGSAQFSLALTYSLPSLAGTTSPLFSTTYEGKTGAFNGLFGAQYADGVVTLAYWESSKTTASFGSQSISVDATSGPLTIVWSHASNNITSLAAYAGETLLGTITSSGALNFAGTNLGILTVGGKGTANSTNVTAGYAAASSLDLLGMQVVTGSVMDDAAIKSYIGTVPVPEPTTATLSLLALAGLAARRRRK